MHPGIVTGPADVGIPDKVITFEEFGRRLMLTGKASKFPECTDR
jgi:hypothetical protein